MSFPLNRRDFIAASAAASVGLLTARLAQATPFKTKLSKAMTLGAPEEDLLKTLKDAGFDGMETNAWKVTPDEAAKSRERADAIGMKLHSVLFGWANFNQENKVEEDIANVQKALQATKGYGGSALLLVPCRIGGMPMPEAWDFDIEFDEKTGHIRRVVADDNSKYQKYIEAHNQAVDASREAVQKLIPTAEKTGVIIALENVWNNLWVKPAFFANFVKSFDNPWVRCYFDIGNHVKYAPPEEWIRTLGALIVKFHVKDFKLKPNGHGGTFVHPRDGSISWPAVRKEIDAIGYNGFLTIEDGGLSYPEFSKRLDLIVAGK